MDDQEIKQWLSIKLEEACLYGDHDLSKSLLKLGANPNSNHLNQEKSTPLWHVIHKGARGYQGMVSALIGAGAEVNQEYVDYSFDCGIGDELRLGVHVK